MTLTTRILNLDDPDWQRLESDLQSRGIPVPMMHRATALSLAGQKRTRFIAAEDANGRVVAGCAVEHRLVSPFPRHVLLRVRQLAPPADPEARAALARALAQYVADDAAYLRLQVHVFDRDARLRSEMGAALEREGFSERSVQGYARTLAIDLEPEEEQVFAGLARSARRNIRRIAKEPSVEIRSIDDLGARQRLDALYAESLGRTGGDVTPPDWELPIGLSNRRPDLSRFVGLFRRDVPPEQGLLAFAWGQWHGDRVEYSHGASTRDTQTKLALSYGLIWDLAVWAKRQGARWFDLGGVTQGSLEDADDALGGISDFKRFFSQELVEVAQEWELWSTSWRARLAAAGVQARRRFR